MNQVTSDDIRRLRAAIGFAAADIGLCLLGIALAINSASSPAGQGMIAIVLIILAVGCIMGTIKARRIRDGEES